MTGRRPSAHSRLEQELAARRRFASPVSEQEWAGLAGQFRPPDSFYGDLAVALAARREPEDAAVGLAAGGEEDDKGREPLSEEDNVLPAWTLLPDPWAHTMRNPVHRMHTLGHRRQHLHGVTDAASALARRPVA